MDRKTRQLSSALSSFAVADPLTWQWALLKTPGEEERRRRQQEPVLV
jgi:hypothetical protein